MVTLTIDNRWLVIEGADPATIRELDAATSYLVEGHYFAPAFRAHAWDGKEHLLKLHKPSGKWRVPSGLGLTVAKKLTKLGVAYKTVNGTSKGERRELAWNPEVVLRDYQAAAVDTFMNKPFPGIGVFKIPIRCGKTKTAGGVIHRIGASTLFIVPSKLLLHQTKKALEECFPAERIGLVGDSEYDPQFITVASVQTLAKLRADGDPRWTHLSTSFDLMVLDEAHHARGGGDWHHVFAEVEARYRLGLSATAYVKQTQEQGRGIIWLRATCGEICVDISMTEMIERGFLMRQNVRMYTVKEPSAYRKIGYSQTTMQQCIHENPERNRLISQLAKEHADAGRRVIIVVNRKNHIAALEHFFEMNGARYRVITGDDGQERREDVISGLRAGHYRIVIGTVLREGVDIPSVDVVINAEGGKDLKNTVQRQRNLTVSAGKEQAIFIDFYDAMNKTLESHSKKRLEAYRSEESFNVEFIGGEPPRGRK